MAENDRHTQGGFSHTHSFVCAAYACGMDLHEQLVRLYLTQRYRFYAECAVLFVYDGGFGLDPVLHGAAHSSFMPGLHSMSILG